MAKEIFDLSKIIKVDQSKKIDSEEVKESNKVGRKKGEETVLISVKVLKRNLPDFDNLAKFENKTRTQYINDLIEQEIEKKKELLILVNKFRGNDK